MDMLGYLWQKSRDEEHPYQEGNLQAELRDALAVLLDWLPTSLKS
jgi:hypothetical protein